MLAKAFQKIAGLLLNPGDEGAVKELAEIETELQSLKEGQFFVDQINTAQKVPKEKKF